MTQLTRADFTGDFHPYTCEYCTGSGTVTADGTYISNGDRPAWVTQDGYDQHMKDCHFLLPNAPPMADWATHRHHELSAPDFERFRRDVYELLGRLDAVTIYEMEHGRGGEGWNVRWLAVMHSRQNVRTSLAEASIAAEKNA